MGQSHVVQLTTALLKCLWGCEFYVMRGVLTTVSISETVPKHCDNLWILDCLCGGRMGQSPVVQLTNALLECLWQTQLLVCPILDDNCCADPHLVS